MSKELEGRNQAMYQMYAEGKSIQSIASQYGITRQAVSKIIARYGQDGAVSDDEYRGLHRAQLEAMMNDLVSMYYETPPPMFDVKGVMLREECQEPGCSGWLHFEDKVVRCNHGEPIRDRKIKLDTADQARKISESLRRMDATDLPRRKQIDADEARRQAEEWLASLPRAEVEDS